MNDGELVAQPFVLGIRGLVVLRAPLAPLDEALEEGAGPLAVASRLLPFLH
jgi:hypothetical protein